jgi:hypothetical protein
MQGACLSGQWDDCPHSQATISASASFTPGPILYHVGGIVQQRLIVRNFVMLPCLASNEAVMKKSRYHDLFQISRTIPNVVYNAPPRTGPKDRRQQLRSMPMLSFQERQQSYPCLMTTKADEKPQSSAKGPSKTVHPPRSQLVRPRFVPRAHRSFETSRTPEASGTVKQYHSGRIAGALRITADDLNLVCCDRLAAVLHLERDVLDQESPDLVAETVGVKRALLLQVAPG